MSASKLERVSGPKYAVIFPGQGSQKPGMGKAIHDCSPAAKSVFSEIGEALSMNVAELCFNADTETLQQTDNAQIALYTTSVATYRALEEELDSTDLPGAMAGHSVGEYAALTCAGVLSVENGAELVRKRGDLMVRLGALRPGAMAAILGLDDATIEKVCDQAGKDGGEVVVANYNCPGQVVISGDKEAVGQACNRLKEAGAKRCLPLNVSGAFHSPLMTDAGEPMREALRQASFKNPLNAPVLISNVTAEPVSSSEEWPELLVRQLASPVRWSQSMLELRRLGTALFAECGPGEVLSGLLRRIDSEAKAVAVHDDKTRASAVAAIMEHNA